MGVGSRLGEDIFYNSPRKGTGALVFLQDNVDFKARFQVFSRAAVHKVLLYVYTV